MQGRPVTSAPPSAATIEQPIVTVRGLTKDYPGGFRAVDGIDFSVHKGEIFGILGPNGAGKSTTMRMLYGRTPITAGEVSILGCDPRVTPRQLRAQIGIVAQEDNLDPDLRVEQNLMVYARYFDLPKAVAAARAQDVLELFQLWERREAKVDELSGGMKRRLVIARALINQPRLLILDEPTTGLDPQARQLVWQKLRYLAGQGVTMLLTTHYMEEAAQLCARLVIMDGGHILAEGSPSALIEQHTRPYVLEVRHNGDERVDSHTLALPDATFEEVGDTLYVYTPHLIDARSLNLPVSIPTLTRPASLEDVFLRLTGRGLQE